MFIAESDMIELSEQELMSFINEAASSGPNELKKQIIDPMIGKLNDPKVKSSYIAIANEFIDLNADMLAKQFPTVTVAFPRLYVDNILDVFGYKTKEFTELLKQVARSEYGDKLPSLNTVFKNPTHTIHSIVLIYADINYDRVLRDAAKQQLALTFYSALYRKYYPDMDPNPNTMKYMYSTLNRSWDIIKNENVVNWIGALVETCYGCYRTKMNLDINAVTLFGFINRLQTSFNQSMQLLANKYYENLDKASLVGNDVVGDEEYFNTGSYQHLTNNLVRTIENQDKYYYDKTLLYPGIAKSKNIKIEVLYDFATQKVDMDDVRKIVNTILYVFLVKENHEVKDISSAAFLGRITNLPTSIDRAIAGQPIVIPMQKKYNVDENVVRSYICFIATYLVVKLNSISK